MKQCTVANFLTGQGKLAIWKSRKLANEGTNVNLLQLFMALVESRVVVENKFFQLTKNLPEFEFKWCVNGALTSLGEDGTLIFNW